MQVSFRRTDKPDESVMVHVVDGATKRGLRLQSHGSSWVVISRQDLGEKVEQEQVGEYLMNHEYVPVTVSDQEFNKFYERVSTSSPLLRSDFDPAQAPTLRELVEESMADYAERLVHVLTPYGC